MVHTTGLSGGFDFLHSSLYADVLASVPSENSFADHVPANRAVILVDGGNDFIHFLTRITCSLHPQPGRLSLSAGSRGPDLQRTAPHRRGLPDSGGSVRDGNPEADRLTLIRKIPSLNSVQHSLNTNHQGLHRLGGVLFMRMLYTPLPNLFLELIVHELKNGTFTFKESSDMLLIS